MPLHQTYLPIIDECLKAISDKGLIPSDRPLKDGLYDFENEKHPGVKYAMAVHNLATYFKNVNGFTEVAFIKSKLTALDSYLFEAKISDPTAYFAATALRAYLKKINISLLSEPYKNSSLPAMITKPIIEALAYIESNQKNLRENIIGKIDLQHQQIELMTLAEEFSQFDDSQKAKYAKLYLKRIAIYENSLQLNKKIAETEHAAAKAALAEIKKDDQSEETLMKRAYLDGQSVQHEFTLMLASRFEVQTLEFKTTVLKAIPKEHAHSHLQSLEKGIELRKRRKLTEKTDAAKILKIDYLSEYAAFGCGDQVALKVLRILHKKAESEAHPARFSLARILPTSVKHRKAYKEKLLAFMDSQLRKQAIEESSAVKSLETSLSTDLASQQDTLKAKLEHWENEKKAYDQRFFLYRWFNPRATALTELDKLVGKLIRTISTGETSTIHNEALMLAAFLETNVDTLSKSVSMQQRADMVAILNQSINYSNRMSQLEVVSSSVSKSDTKIIFNQLTQDKSAVRLGQSLADAVVPRRLIEKLSEQKKPLIEQTSTPAVDSTQATTTRTRQP